MKLEDISNRNRKFQKAAMKVTNLFPGGQVVMMTSVIMRSSKKLDVIFPKLLTAKTEMRFSIVLEKIEEEMDEIVYALDKLSLLNRRDRLPMLTEFVKYGYDLLSIYSFACDKIIERRVTEDL